MPLEQIRCTNCGSVDVLELKPNTYACRSCETIFKYVDPTHTEVAPQFCEEGCGNPIKYKCALCGKMVCEAHGDKAKELISARRPFDSGTHTATMLGATTPELQKIWCVTCYKNMDARRLSVYVAQELNSEDFWSRLNTVTILERLSDVDPSVTPLLIQALDDNWDIAGRAAKALAITGPAALPFLEEALKSPRKKLRKGAARALVIMKGKMAADARRRPPN